MAVSQNSKLRPISRVLATLSDKEIEMVAGGDKCYTQTCVTTRGGHVQSCTPATSDPCN